MRRSTVARVCLGLAFLAATTWGTAAQPAPQATVPDRAVAVESLLAEVKEALASASDQVSRGALVLDSVTLQLEAVAVAQTSSRVRFFILEFGTSRTATATSTLTLVLGRPGAERPATGLTQQSRLVQALSAAIVAAGEAASTGWDSIEGLVPKSVSCEVSFGVTREGSGGLNVAVMSLVAGAGRTSSREAVQTIKMTFTPKKQGPPS